MSITSLQFAILNVTSIENLSRKTKVWTLAVYMPHPPPPSIIASFQTITYPLNYLHASPSKNTTARTFAILHSKPGENPFYLGKYKNFQSVMGYGFLDWVLPLRYSPCCDHSSDESAFALGPAVQRMRKDAGINDSMSKGRRHRRRSRRHSRAGTGPPVNGDEIQEAKVEQGGSEMTTEGDGSLAK
jgi:palmitoyltransferase